MDRVQKPHHQSVFSLWTLALQHPCELHWNQRCNFQMTLLMTIEQFKVYFLWETIKIEILLVTLLERVHPHTELSLSQQGTACRNGSLAVLGKWGQTRNMTAIWKIAERLRFYFFQQTWVVKSFILTSRDVTAVDLSVKWQWYWDRKTNWNLFNKLLGMNLEINTNLLLIILNLEVYRETTEYLG